MTKNIINLKKFDYSIDFDFNFDELKNNKNLLEIINYVRPNWTNYDFIKYKVFTEGSTNRLIGFDYSNKEETFLMRLYGLNTELFIDRDSEIENTCKLNEKQFCPPIFCTFKNGLCYGFIEGRPLCKEELKEIGFLTSKIAEEMAKLHSMKFDDDKIEKNSFLPKLFDKIFFLLNQNRDKFTKILNEIGFINVDCLKKEADYIFNLLSNLNSPTVFCHNDLLMKNIIYNEDTKSLFFIDYEYSDFNYQSFDVANHFCEYSGQDPYEITLYPSKEYQLEWIKEYLKHYDELNNIKCNNVELEKRIEDLYDQTCKCCLASSLLWGTWALLQSHLSTLDFNFVKYAKARLNAYLTFKKKYGLV